MHEHVARDHLLVRAEQLDRIGVVGQCAAIVAGAFQRQSAQIVCVLIGRRAPDILVRNFDRFRIIGQPQEDADRSVERTQWRTAILDEFVKPVGGLPPVAELVEQQREIVDALLIARLALELFELQPDRGIARCRDRQRANPRIDGFKHFVGIIGQVARAYRA